MSSVVKKRVAEYFPERWVRKKLKLVTYESDISDISDIPDISDISDISDTSDPSDIDSGYRSEEF